MLNALLNLERPNIICGNFPNKEHKELKTKKKVGSTILMKLSAITQLSTQHRNYVCSKAFEYLIASTMDRRLGEFSPAPGALINFPEWYLLECGGGGGSLYGNIQRENVIKNE